MPTALGQPGRERVGVEIRPWAGRGGVFRVGGTYPLPSPGFGRRGRFYAADLRRKRKKPDHGRPGWGRLREGAESYAKALASDILR